MTAGEIRYGGVSFIAMSIARAATARKLAADLSNMAALAAELADEAVWQATRSEPAREVARALGVSEAAVRKAIQQHNRRVAGRIVR